jgi:nitrogen regulatory protein P-II 1
MPGGRTSSRPWAWPRGHAEALRRLRRLCLEAYAATMGGPGGVCFMKLIIAIIQPNKLEAVKQALSDVEVFRLTVLDVQGFGRQRGHAEAYRGHEIAVNLLRKVQLQIAVNDDFVEPTIAAIVKGGRSGDEGEIGDGKIFVLPMDECVRIRTGERGIEAI